MKNEEGGGIAQCVPTRIEMRLSICTPHKYADIREMSNELTILKDIKDKTGTKNDRGTIIFYTSYSGGEGVDGIMANSTEGL